MQIMSHRATGISRGNYVMVGDGRIDQSVEGYRDPATWSFYQRFNMQKPVQRLNGLDFWESVRSGSCGVSFGGVSFIDLDFADDSMVFAESLDSLVSTLEALSKSLQYLASRFAGPKQEPSHLVTWKKTAANLFLLGTSVDFTNHSPIWAVLSI